MVGVGGGDFFLDANGRRFVCVSMRNRRVCAVSWNVCLRETGGGALTRQTLMHVFIRAWGEAERTGQ